MGSKTLPQALAEADAEGLTPLVLGGGSNLVVADRGYPGLVLKLDARGRRVTPDRDHVQVRVEAGHDWDELVAWAVAEDLAGIECLSGIPGRVGAAPMQNIGAYGQEVAGSLVEVEAVELTSGATHTFPADACELGYRTSRFKHRERGRWIVTAVTLRLQRGGSPVLRYAELVRRSAELGPTPTLQQVRALVLAIRRSKSMVLDPADPDARSAGSFFTNPIVDDATADEVRARAARRGITSDVPAWSMPTGTKLAAAWLIERAGFGKGWGDGPAGLSTKHTLAIVNRGGATAADVLRVAATVRRGVRDAFGVTLVPEPVFVGFDAGPDPTSVLDEAERTLSSPSPRSPRE